VTAVDHLSHARPFASRFRAAAVAGGIAAWLGGALGCVDTGPRKGTPAPVTNPTCEVTPPVPYAGAAVIPSQDPALEPACPSGLTCPYAWKNVTIKGGGFVSGIITSPALAGLVFARTDVGGAYRFDPANGRWMAITDWVGHDDGNLTGIESIAPDPVDPNRVYLAAGTYLTGGNGAILRSTDMGQTWARTNIPAPMGGNADGRSMGERLAVDPNLPSTLFFGSRNAGLWTSSDSAVTWTKVDSFPTTAASNNDGVTGYGLTLVLFDPRSGSAGSATPAIYVGVGLVGMGTTPDTALYRSTDAGATWQPVPGQPTGMMPHHAALDGCGNIYFTYNDGGGPNGPKPANLTTPNYSYVNKGAVWRLDTASDTWIDVSPPHGAGGFGGISADAAHPGTLIATTLDRWSPDEIYRTTNGGGTWAPIGSGAARDVAGAVWLSFHTSTLSSTGWMGDVEIDPFNPARALYVTGQGVWSSDDVNAADTTGGQIHWTFDDAGLEETVTLDLASPPAGPPLLSGVGDIAGFRHDDLTVSPPGGMYPNPVFGNTSSLDFAENAPNVVARVGTNSVPARTGAYSIDGGASWAQFPTLPTGTTGQGSIAVSADGATFVWATPRGGTPSYSIDRGAHWIASTGLVAGARVAADRVNPTKFYASNRNAIYVSTDGGASFKQTATATGAVRPRPVFGVEGDLWVPASNGLLHSQDSGATFTPTPVVSVAAAVGFGMPAPGATYPAVYLAGSVSGTWGVYRSDDAGTTWTRIDDPQHQFGVINNVAGDPRIYGRVYLGTGGRGIVYGDVR
jgi:photosystem II stability/assembly factor-like uncharacterized protein